jgi:hypothetical protein
MNDERAGYISSCAYQMAASGHHLEPITIISAFINEGYPEAEQMLDKPLIRDDLRAVCARNWPGVPLQIEDGPEAGSEPDEPATNGA